MVLLKEKKAIEKEKERQKTLKLKMRREKEEEQMQIEQLTESIKELKEKYQLMWGSYYIQLR